MKRSLPLFLALATVLVVWLHAQTSPAPSVSPTASVANSPAPPNSPAPLDSAKPSNPAAAKLLPDGEDSLCSSSEGKFWGTALVLLIVLLIAAALFRAQVRPALTSAAGRHVLIVAGLLMLATLGSHMVAGEACRESRAWSRTLDPNLEDTVGSRDQLTITAAAITPATQRRLREQFVEIRGRARHHLRVMAYFFANYYRAIQMMALLGAIAAVALFFVAFKGWNGTNPYVQNLFITATILAAYFSLYPTVFKQQDNITDNKNLYLQYVALQEKVRTYAATGDPHLASASANPKEADFLENVDEQMATLNNIAIGFDYSKVSYKDVFSTAQKTPAPVTAQTPAAGSGGAKKGK